LFANLLGKTEQEPPAEPEHELEHEPEYAPMASPDPGASERRMFARVAVDLVVEMEFENVHELAQSRALDIAVGGVFVKTVKPRELGTSVKLRFVIGGNPMTLLGEVVRCALPTDTGTPGMGIRFTDLTPPQRALLDALVNAKTR
jgi:uncharacterized protein (TIGR02266 family)